MRASVGGSTSERAARRAWYRGSSGSGAVVLGGSLAARGRCRLRAADEDGERLETSEPRQSEGVTWEGGQSSAEMRMGGVGPALSTTDQRCARV